MKKFISLLGCVSLSACASEGVYSQNEALKDAIFQTPYSAVVKVTGFEKFSEHEEGVLFKVQAEVIQKLRGDVGSEITFSMYGELGDEPNIHHDPVILTLCHDKDTYYWPGTGAEFEANQENILYAQETAAHLDIEQHHFAHCSE
ncbi:TPA: hypothetical protein ACMDN7_002578 [Vibrio parahaemolyticus]